MSLFTCHDLQSAPDESKPLLEQSQKDFGMIPNLHAVMAEAPGLLQAYKSLHQHFANSSFNNEQLTVVWQTINVYHQCHYCVPAHTAIAQIMGVSQEISDALRNNKPLTNLDLQTLREFTIKLLDNRGNVAQDEVQAFLDQGFSQRQVLEIVLGIAQKVMSNYTNHLANTPVDEPFKAFTWPDNNH